MLLIAQDLASSKLLPIQLYLSWNVLQGGFCILLNVCPFGIRHFKFFDDAIDMVLVEGLGYSRFIHLMFIACLDFKSDALAVFIPIESAPTQAIAKISQSK